MTSQTQNTPASIQETVENTLRTAGYSTYITYARPVVEALNEREKAISEALLGLAETLGADDTDAVRDGLKAAGLQVKDVEPETTEAAATGEGDVMTMLQGIARQIESLTQFARSNGYRG